MANTHASSGSQTATVNTEHSLYSTTTAGTYVLEVDLNAMAAGDVLTLRIRKKVRTGDTVYTVYVHSFYGAVQTDMGDTPTKMAVVQSIAIPTVFGADFTLEQTFGTGRAYPWGVILLG